MKRIEDFKNNELKNNTNLFFGGKDIATTYCTSNNEEWCDTWSDNDNDGTFSVGDNFCFYECPPE